MPIKRDGSGQASAIRVIEIVDVFVARIASFLRAVDKLAIEGCLQLFVFGHRLDHHVAVGEDLVRGRRAQIARAGLACRPAWRGRS